MEEMRPQSFGFRGIPVYYLEGGSGTPVLLLHGSGAGASTMGYWQLVLEPLAERHRVYAMDLIGFGQSGRKPQPPYFDVPLWLEQCREMVARIPEPEVTVVGHSLSGYLALKLAGSEPRIRKVVTTGTMGAVFTPNEASLRAWTFPRNRDELRRAAEALIYDSRLIGEAYLSNREKVLFTGDYETYFGSMFEGDKRRYIDQMLLGAEDLARVRCPVMMIHGREDLGFPAEPLTLTLSRSLPHADVILLGQCSHSVAFDQPAKLVELIKAFTAE